MADFASLMGAALGKKKTNPTVAAKVPEPTTNPKSTNDSGNKAFLRRAELEAQREAEYRAEQEAATRAKEERLAAKRKLEEEEIERNAIREEKRRKLAEESRARREAEELEEEEKRRKRVGLPSLAEKRAAEVAKQEEEAAALALDNFGDIEEDDLRSKLRELEEPTVLFAESHAARLRRYRTLVAPKPVLSNTPIPTTLPLVSEAEMLVEITKPPPPKTKERAHLLSQLASYFTMILIEWIGALDGRDAAVKASSQGKTAASAMEQSRENLRPLFKKLESGDIENGVLEPIIEIVRAAQRRRYVEANDAYLTLSIGKAAWPIGVTMVGIHERS